MKRISVVFLFVLISLSINLYAQEKSSNSFVSYMKGRSIVGLNFSPAIYNAVGNALFKSVAVTIAGNENNARNIKASGYAMNFNYDLTVLPYMAISVDAGFSFTSYIVNGYTARYDTIPWSVGIKFFTGSKAPYGFFVFPKIGGTDLKIRGSLITEAGFRDMHYHGVYASVELGWRIQLFPKTGANWPVQVAIDISLLDVGYYFVPWGDKALFRDLGINFGSWIVNTKLMILPRIGVSLRF